MRRIHLAFAALLATSLWAQDRLTPELLWKLGRVGEPQPSPDGKSLLYSVRTYDLAANSGISQIHLLDLASGTSRQLTMEGSNSGAQWSKDGKQIAFLSTRSGAPQIHVMPIDGGEARQVTRREGGVANLAWSPTNTHFSFTAEVQLDPDVHDLYPDLPHASGAIFDRLPIRHWDEWKSGKYSHLFVIAADGTGEHDLMTDARFDTPVKPFGGAEQIAWSPDGQELCYTAKKVEGSAWVESTDNDLYVVPIGGGAARNLTAGMPGYDQDPAYSPDGKWIAFHSMARAGFEADRNRIMLLDRQTGAIRELTEGFDQSAHHAAWAPDSSALYFDSEMLGTTQVFTVAIAGGKPEQISAGRYDFQGPVPSSDGKFLFCGRQSTERPTEIVRLSTASRATGRDASGVAVTDVNGALFQQLSLPRVEERWFRATDQERIHAWVVYPPDFDPAKTWPMLLYCQGGPQSQVGQWFSYRWNFHVMAAHGYIVLAVNRRGLPGFGQAWNDQISGDWGGQAMQDLLTATDQMFTESYVDRQHTAAVGASFGGYSIYWLMGHDQERRFAAMVAHCGVFHLDAMYGSTEELWFPNWDLGGPYWKDAETAQEYARFSPHSFAGNWHTPLLVVHGERDFRVPVTQGIEAFTVAQVRGVPSRFLYFPDEGHWVSRPQNGVLWHRVFFDWLDRYCKPEAGAVSSRTVKSERKYLLERVGDAAVVQLYADGFDRLPLRDKLLSYHLAQAAIAGRDIFLDQKFAHALELRDLLEELFVHRAVLPSDVRAEIERYTKLFWVHSGIHNAITTKKDLLRLAPEQFRDAVNAAIRDGAQVDRDEQRLMALYEIVTAPGTFVSCTNKTPGDGADSLLASCNNLYVGVASSDLEGFAERHPLNSRLVKMPDGSLVEQVYRAGDGDEHPPGLYARQLTEVIRHLEDALHYAPEKTAAALRSLIRYYRTGDPADWRAFNIAWVQDTDSFVDQINGFVEVYLDARGQKGAWEAVVSFLNAEKTGAIERLAAQAQWFEDRMPWDDEFKKKDVKGISARAISVITETGDSGPITPIGINLPNEADIRQDYGSKSVNLSNVVEAYEASRAGSSAAEFAWSEEEAARAKKWSALSGDIHTNLHEVIGHASGRVRDDMQNPAAELGNYYSTLEEGRADLVALYWISDPKLQELGIVPDPEVALAEYESYARNALVQLRRVALGDRIEEDHMRNRQMIVHWLIASSDAIAVEKRDGKTYYRVTGVDAFRAGCGKLLAEVMRIKATGDAAAGKELVEKYGTHVDRALHEEVLARLEKLNLPAVTGFVQPELRLVRNPRGEVTDVEVFHPMDLADQMLRWSGRR